MGAHNPNYSVNVPEQFIGHVCAELSDRGGLIVAMDNMNGIYDIRAEMPDGTMTDFEIWLGKTTQGRGVLKTC
jgi:translation elongation factor EF-G